ncbi:hypothetical protein B5M42_004445 [Paenibacillus athensensis]|uniref:Uncharacterized protein n=1 Tax=Paenibacillus athensensis TaxID=1967502 RepID=A0A4Y8PR63_9BACL|nr:hypothetical protein [Paenibacillus athensensis]MCD1258088.1 hypothetical protein [Paenibacillus athensensis]
MIKYSAISEAQPGTFSLPLLLTTQETQLTVVALQQVEPGDRIELVYSLAWEKPAHRDIGEIELTLRRGAPDGPVVSWSEETCYQKAVSTGRHSEISATAGDLLFYLSAASFDQRAIAIGPLLLKGTVFSGTS